MKKVILWFFLCCKRYLKRIPFLLLLAALPLTALAASYPGWRARIATMPRYGQTRTGLVEDAAVVIGAAVIVGLVGGAGGRGSQR